MGTVRYDIVHDGRGAPRPEPHFCRTFEMAADGEEVGCYGTNPNHGYTWEEVCREMAVWHRSQAEDWESGPMEPYA